PNGERIRYSLSVPETGQYFVQRNHCSDAGTRTDFPESGRSPETRAYRIVQSGCANNAEVDFYLISGGGHNWPGVTGTIPEQIAGRVNMDINASEEIWAFFKRHTLSERPRYGGSARAARH